MKSTEWLKPVLAISAVLVLGACAKSQPETLPQCPTVPVQIVNYESNVLIIPEAPSTKKLVRITKNDDARDSLETVLNYTAALKEHSDTVTTIANQCIAEIADRDKRLKAVKQYLLLNQ